VTPGGALMIGGVVHEVQETTEGADNLYLVRDVCSSSEEDEDVKSEDSEGVD